MLVFDSGDGQQDENCIQWCWQWTTARWWSEDGAVPAVGRDSVKDNGNSSGDGQQQWWQRWMMERMLDDGRGQWALKAVMTRQQRS